MKDSYVTSMRFYSVGEENIQVKARVFRSQRKTEEPHQVNLDTYSCTSQTMHTAAARLGMYGVEKITIVLKMLVFCSVVVINQLTN